MKIIINSIASLILATWVVTIAIFSVQNATLVSLNFLGFKSIQLPVGIVLAFGVGTGVVGGAIAVPLFISTQRQDNEEYDDSEDESDNNNPGNSEDDWV